MAYQVLPVRALLQARHALHSPSWTSVLHRRAQAAEFEFRCAFSTRARRNRDDVGILPPSLHNNETISKAGPVTVHDKHQWQQSRPENKLATYSIKRAARIRDWDAAWETFRGLESPDPLVFNAVLHAADMSNKYTEAFQLYDKMREAGLPRSAVTFSPLVRLAGRFRKLDQALALVNEMRQEGIELNGHIYSALIEAHKFSKDPQGALGVWQELQAASVPVSASILCTIMAAVANGGDVAGTEALLREQHGVVPNIAHYNCLLLACRNAGDPDGAWRFLQELRECGLRPDVIAYTSLMGSLRSAGHPVAEVARVIQGMAEDKVAPDGFFVEAHLAYVASVPVGSDLRAVGLHEQPPQVLERLREMIREAREAGINLSNYTSALETNLRQLEEAAQFATANQHPTAGADWVKVVSDADSGAAPTEYYWDRMSGRTQWQPPLGAVTVTVSVASAA